MHQSTPHHAFTGRCCKQAGLLAVSTGAAKNQLMHVALLIVPSATCHGGNPSISYYCCTASRAPQATLMDSPCDGCKGPHAFNGCAAISCAGCERLNRGIPPKVAKTPYRVRGGVPLPSCSCRSKTGPSHWSSAAAAVANQTRVNHFIALLGHVCCIMCPSIWPDDRPWEPR